MAAAIKTPVRRGTQCLIFSAHGAEWRAVITRGADGDLVYIFIHPERDKFGKYDRRLDPLYISVANLCRLVNALLGRRSGAAIADIFHSVFKVTNGHALAAISPEYTEFLPQIIRLLKRDA